MMAAPAFGLSGLIPQAVTVDRSWWETADTASLELVAAGSAGLGFKPGQFSMLYIPGVGEAPLSISGDPALADRLRYTIRRAGAVTDALCALHPGDHLGMRGPYGSSWPLDDLGGRDVVVVAGGIGLAPLRGAILQLFRRREELASLSVVYGARQPSDLLFTHDLHDWRASFDADVLVTVDRATGDYRGHVGTVVQRFGQLSFDPENAIVLTCGPEIMMIVVAREMAAAGVEPSRIHLSMERHMKCGIGLCGRCQYGPIFVCTDGPVEAWRELAPRMRVSQL